jgi:putative CocE/NonD family hydrolase
MSPAEEMTDPMSTSYSVTVDVPVPMQDGTNLATNIWRPEVTHPVPALLVRTPYDKLLPQSYGYTSPNIFALVEAGYAVAVQDTRGTGRSQGVFTPHVDDPNDGADTVSWLAAQDWCDGKIGSWGVSYLGFVQWQTAITRVDGLKAIAPGLTSADFYRAPWYSPGGALSLDLLLSWSALISVNELLRGISNGDGDLADLPGLAGALTNPATLTSITPVSAQKLVARYLPWAVTDVIARPNRDDAWQALSAIDQASSITVPALNIGGWYDLFYGETLRAYTQMRRYGGTTDARQGQRLIIGPWSHTNQSGTFRDRIFGFHATAAAADLTTTHLSFFDHWLRRRNGSVDDTAPVRLFVMGIDQWRDEQDWPLPDTRYTDYFLHGSGPANSARGAGRMSTDMPVCDFVDSYLYDPRRPVPSLGGTVLKFAGHEGPVDQRPIHGRDDILCFITDVLRESIEVTGPVSATIFVSSSAFDTDFTAKLVDVHPDGTAIILCDGIQRMRYRESLTNPRPMVPDEIYQITIDLIATSNVFLPGHQLLLEISSSNFPRYDRNSNTGGAIANEHETVMKTAVNRVHRGAHFPSRLTLPIIDRRE